jgi:hypothetical protein
VNSVWLVELLLCLCVSWFFHVMSAGALWACLQKFLVKDNKFKYEK